MLKQSRLYWEEINNIGERFSESDADEHSDSEDMTFGKYNYLFDTEYESNDADEEEENIGNKREGQTRMQLLSCSKEANDKMISTYQLMKLFGKMQLSATPGSIALHNIFKKEPGLVGHTKRKFSGDLTNKMTPKYTTKSKSFRWHVQVFFNIFDLAGINETGENISRKDFLFQLAVELAIDCR